MKLLIVLVILQGVIFTNVIAAQTPGKLRARPCNTPMLKNGMVRLRSNGRFVRFVCNSEFTLIGMATTSCTNGRWEGELPNCVAPGCAEIASPPNAVLIYLRRGVGLKLICNSRYELVGNDQAFCDGIQWDRKIGSCRETNITSPLFCDFEGRGMCGWSNYLLNEKDWLNTNMGRHGIGPQHDHTKMTKYEGFFMLLEGDSPRHAKPVYFFSPMYDAYVSNNSCFKFYYHMYGVVTGTIRIFVKTAKQTDANFFSSLSIVRKSALLEIANRSSNAWIEALVRLPKLGDNFQIVIQGELMRGQRTDLAIDDVEILNGADCEADKAVVTEKPEDEEGGINQVITCQNRCDTLGLVRQMSSKNLLFCDCTTGCLDNCCPDYEQFCIFGETTTLDVYTTNMIEPIPPLVVNNTTTEIINWNTTRSTPTSTTLTTTTMKPLPAPITTITMRPWRPTTIKPKIIIRKTTKGSDISEFESTPHLMNDASIVEVLPEKFDPKNEHFAKVIAEKTGVPKWLILTGILLGITIIGTVVGLYVYRERTRVATPAEMKRKYHCKSANEEFSEIRFLTEDEHLDFTLATPMDD